MPPFRNQRLANLIKRELSQMIVRDFNFDGALATITFVKISDGSSFAEIGVSVIPSSEGDRVVKILKRSQKMFLKKLIKILNIRHVPDLSFVLDSSLESGAKVEKLLLNE